MDKKIIFKIDKKLDFQNHLISMKVCKERYGFDKYPCGKYYKKLYEADEVKRYKIFEQTALVYKPEYKRFRELAVRQTQEVWDIVEIDYILKMEKIHGNLFPRDIVYGILSTTPDRRYGYNFNKDISWFACQFYSPLYAINTTMHEIMHLFFHEYFEKDYMAKFSLSKNEIWLVKEALTVILNLECKDLIVRSDTGKLNHNELREKIKADWLKCKDFKKVLDNACVAVKTLEIVK